MKRIILTFYILTGLLSGTGKVHANVFSPVGSYEKLHRVKRLSPDYKYQTKDGEHLDLGIKYSVWHVFGIPLWQQEEPVFVGYLDKHNYLPLNDEIILVLAQNNNIENLTALKRLPFWDAWGGKIVFLLSLSGIFYLLFNKKKERIPVLT